MSTNSKTLVRALSLQNQQANASVSQLQAVMRELDTFEESIDPDGDPGTILAGTITEYVADAGTTFTTKAIFAVPNLYSTATGITAGTTQTQAGATQLTAEWNNVTTVAVANDGVKLPTAVAGLSITIKNTGANTAKVYPFLGDFIDDELVNVAVTIAVEQEITFRCISSTVWESNIENITVTSITTGTLTTTGRTILGAGQKVARTATSTTPYTVLVSDYYIAIDCSGGAKTAVLPAAATVGAGTVYIFKDVTGNAAANNITIDGSGAETIDGAATLVMNTNYQSVTLISNGTNWEVN